MPTVSNVLRIRSPHAFNSIGSKRLMSDAAAEAVPQAAAAAPKAEILRYNRLTSYLHWFTALGFFVTIAAVKGQQYTPKDSTLAGLNKGEWMWWHKSFGISMLGLAIPRVLLRLVTRAPEHIAGPWIYKKFASLGHVAMYGFALGMPITGGIMGYYGGKGQPFFLTTIPGAEEPNGEWAKKAYEYHTLAGKFLPWVISLHMMAGVTHQIIGHNVFGRIALVG